MYLGFGQNGLYPTTEQVQKMLAPLEDRITQLESEVARLGGSHS